MVLNQSQREIPAVRAPGHRERLVRAQRISGAGQQRHHLLLRAQRGRRRRLSVARKIQVDAAPAARRLEDGVHIRLHVAVIALPPMDQHHGLARTAHRVGDRNSLHIDRFQLAIPSSAILATLSSEHAFAR
jgi:hypothetical protein